eukprot:218112_1
MTVLRDDVIAENDLKNIFVVLFTNQIHLKKVYIDTNDYWKTHRYVSFETVIVAITDALIQQKQYDERKCVMEIHITVDCSNIDIDMNDVGNLFVIMNRKLKDSTLSNSVIIGLQLIWTDLEQEEVRNTVHGMDLSLYVSDIDGSDSFMMSTCEHKWEFRHLY